MSNPCDLAFIRSPRAPGLKEAPELFLETRPDPGRTTVTPPLARPPIPGPADTVMPMANPLAAAAGDLDHMRGEPDVAADLERSLPAMAQRVLDLISRNRPALDSVLSALAGLPRQEARALPIGGRFGRGASGDALGRMERDQPLQRPSLLPHVLMAVQEPLDLAPPLESLPVDPGKLAELPPPPAPAPLAETLAEALATLWAPCDEERSGQEAARVATRDPGPVAARPLRELEAFVGGAMRRVSDRCFEGLHGADRAGGKNVPGSVVAGQAGPWGAPLVALHVLYRAYKADYYSLVRARRALLDRRDPGALVPLLSEEELEDYLWRKYGAALRSRLWRLVRAAAPHARVGQFPG